MPRPPLLLLFACLILGVFGGPPAAAQTEGLGVGASLGVTNGASASARNPVGATGKYWTSDRQAVAGLTSFSIGEGNRSYWMIQGDYLFHNFNALSVEEGLLAPYVGAGTQLSVFEATSNQWALRSPAGLTYLLDSAPLDLFIEVAPTLSVTSPASLRLDGAFGVRYYFSLRRDDASE